MAFRDWLCLCSGLPCPTASVQVQVQESKSFLVPFSAAVHAEVQLKVSHKAQTPLDLCACAQSTGRSVPEDLIPKKKSGIIAVAPTPLL